MYLHEKLDEYEKNGRYPMHMPGHKRQLHEEPYVRDLTEIEGFDNLHHSEDILKSDRERAASFYGAGEARFLVNGSTCGVLAAISAVTEYGDTVIMGRNSHKSAYHALQLRGLLAEYVYPDAFMYSEWGIDGPIPPEEVRRLLEQPEQKTRPKAVFLTSPTYEGVISDVKKIAEICHEHGVPLIVDEAHGAHLKVMEVYGMASHGNGEEEETKGGAEKNGGQFGCALAAGADLVILGLHKTMPVLTQGALLAVSSEAIREGRVFMQVLDEYLGIYETSSPSYVLMGSISRCVHWLDGNYEIEGENVREKAAEYQENLEETRRMLSAMKHLRLFSPGGESCEKRSFGYDPGKLVISSRGTGLTGQGLADNLRRQYDLEIEMASADYIIAMTSMFDTKESFRKFADALLACDEELGEKAGAGAEKNNPAENKKKPGTLLQEEEAKKSEGFREFPRARVAMPIAEALSFARRHPDLVREEKLISRPEKNFQTEEYAQAEKNARTEEAVKKEETVSVDFVYVYPPGIPIVSPGEIITKGVAKKIICDYNSGCALIGCVEREGTPAVRCITVRK